MGSKTKIPHFFGLRIYIVSVLMYLLLVMPFAGLLLLQNLPKLIEKSNEFNFGAGNVRIDNRGLPTLTSPPLTIADTMAAEKQEEHWEMATDLQNEMISSSFDFLTKIALPIAFLAGFIFNYPFKRYFRRKRKGRFISERLFNFCKKYLLLSHWINAAIVGSALAGTLIYMMVLSARSTEAVPMFSRFLVISFFSALLAVLFMYFWQKHRVHIKYIDILFSPEELRRRVFKKNTGKIRYRFWVSSAMTTLLPLSIVMVYLIMSLSRIDQLGLTKLSEDQMQILLGRYSPMLSSSINPNPMGNFGNLFFVNVIDGLVLFFGIGVGIFVSLIYILMFVKWTTQGIVYPVRELIYNMQRTGKGGPTNYTVVRSNDEIGELAERFNDMSGEIESYIANIEKVNMAYYRFVPRQFLDFLGKESITEVQLGDQVQKEMSVLFTDIRDFTSLSEEMTPKGTFDFLNEYLGVMEPLIARNNGFIDKYIGDSIMALFVGNVENAIDAAIEMRAALADFNLQRKLEGKNPVDSGIGIHTGKLMLGVVGGLGRMDGTVVSDAVNLASRIEGLTKIYGTGIIISQDTLIKIQDPGRYNYRFLDVVKVKGKKEAVYILEILDGESQPSRKLKIETKADFGKAMQLYKNKEFDPALELFDNIYHRNPHDHAAALYIARCRNIIDFGLPHDWDGIETHRDKY
ncbi:MAG TPA: adenylate/guanylate cyclase domain-containing protein [Bacteroidales bacterium]|nr:adenylate/guanylate cyclase domain-containing protein [Bacteroidales bacterium]